MRSTSGVGVGNNAALAEVVGTGYGLYRFVQGVTGN